MLELCHLRLTWWLLIESRDSCLQRFALLPASSLPSSSKLPLHSRQGSNFLVNAMLGKMVGFLRVIGKAWQITSCTPPGVLLHVTTWRCWSRWALHQAQKHLSPRTNVWGVYKHVNDLQLIGKQLPWSKNSFPIAEQSQECVSPYEHWNICPRSLVQLAFSILVGLWWKVCCPQHQLLFVCGRLSKQSCLPKLIFTPPFNEVLQFIMQWKSKIILTGKSVWFSKGRYLLCAL